jgi:putative molybdopterin biosynthesis protein
MRRLAPTIAWQIEGSREGPEPVDARLLRLLDAIGEHGSLAQAARSVSVPYRTAWGLLEATEHSLGTPLATLARGRGATLTPLARRWLDASASAASLLAARGPAIDLGGARVAQTARPAPLLRVAASHDIALAQLKDRWRIAHAIALEFHGSAESLGAYRSGRVEIAGFHVATTARGESDPLLARLDAARDAVFRFLTREQGLIVARGNPRRLRGIGDLVAKRLTIVNRQPGSGTRLLFDRLLARASVAGGSVPGYPNEEFTHAAVAATVAAGRADAGFGIRAAAAQFGLGFVPIVTEQYLFACARRALESPRVVAFRELLASRATRAIVTPLPGYSLDAPGKLRALRRG